MEDIRSIRTTKMVVLFSRRNVPNLNSCSSCLKPSLIPVSDFLVCFPVNELIYENSNRSGYDICGFIFTPVVYLFYLFSICILF